MTLSGPTPAAELLLRPLGGAKCSVVTPAAEDLSSVCTRKRSYFHIVVLWLTLIVTRLQVYQMMISTFPGDYADGLWNNLWMLSSYGLRPQFVCDHCLRLSWISSIISALLPRYTAPPQTLINHSTHRVTFALFKKILQTLAFPKSNYLRFHISPANISALRAVYLMVFVYGLTFFFFGCIFIFVK